MFSFHTTEVYCGDPPPFDAETCWSTALEVPRDPGNGLYVYKAAVEYGCLGELKFADGQQKQYVTCSSNGQWTDTNLECLSM